MCIVWDILLGQYTNVVQDGGVSAVKCGILQDISLCKEKGFYMPMMGFEYWEKQCVWDRPLVAQGCYSKGYLHDSSDLM